ncbi:efflux RND transporter permease subunit [Desertivirga arenae]|uniref:efflux RND transporter permease subunit n=1 Tax=Desertivirga arenae TaxID=2810309 RepID=UPI001A95A908|nr:MMPL family transporter [Pedobacter sp. SYSU D00823]
MWEKLSKFVLSNRLTVFLIFLGISVLMGWQASKVQLSFSGSKVLPLTDSAFSTYNQFKARFGEDGSILVLGVQSPKMNDFRTFNDWRDLTKDIQQLHGIQQTLSIGNLFELKKDTLAQKFRLEPLTKEPLKSHAEMVAFKKKLYNQSFYDGLIFNSKNNASLMAITFDRKVLNSKERIPVINAIVAKSQAFSKKHNISLHYSGLPYIRTVISKKVSQEFALFLGLSILVAALILLIFFRSFYAVIFPVLVVIAGVVWSLGILVLFKYDITLLTGLIPPLIVVIGIPNSILLLNKYHSEYRKHQDKLQALRTVISRVAITTFVANLTTAIGFGVLYITKSELLMQFGIVASISVLTTWLMSLCLIPIIFSYLPPPDLKHVKHLDTPFLTKLLKLVDHLVHNRRNWVYLTTVLLLIISIYGISKININGYIVDDLPQNDPVYRDLKFFDTNFEGVMPFEVSVDTRRKNGVMKMPVVNKIERLQQMIASYPEFSRPISLIEVLKFSSQAFYEGNKDFYRVPSDFEMNFILNYAAHSGGNGNLLKSFVDKNRQVTRVSFQMADVGSKRMNELINEIKPRIDSILNPERYTVDVTGTSIIYVKGTNYLVENLRDSLLIAVGLIAILMWILFRGVRMILISLIPNIIPLVITAGIMGFSGIPLKPSTILIYSIAFGIASDQTIYFLTRYRHEMKVSDHSISKLVSDTIAETGISMIYVALILFFGFGIFTASTFGGTVALGILLSITLMVALISNLTLLPALLLSLEKRLAKNKSQHLAKNE